MSTYRAADGHDVVLGSLVDLSPQPSADPAQVTQRDYAADGTVSDQGLFTIWRWSVVANVTEYQAILTALGILSATSNEVTIYTRSPVGTFTRYNGLVVQPLAGNEIAQRDYFLRDLEIVIKGLVASA